MSIPANPTDPASFQRQYESHSEVLLLDVPFGPKTQLSLTKVDQAFSKSSLEQLIEEALDASKDYIFVLAEDDTNKIYFFDGLAFCEWISKSQTNPLNNQEISNAGFFVISKHATLEEIKQGVPAIYLGNLNDYAKEESCFLHHLIDCSYGDERKPILQFNLALDVLLGRGIAQNASVAFQFALKCAQGNNPHCCLLCAYCYKYGLGVDPQPERANFYFQKATMQWNSSDDIQTYYSELKKLIQKSPFEEPSPQDLYESQKFYDLL